MLGAGLNNQLFFIAGYLLPLTEFLTDGEMVLVSERGGTGKYVPGLTLGHG